MLAPITCRTSQYEVTDVIGGNVRTSNTTQGKRMINVVFAPFYLFVAVVALPFLPIILLTNLLCRISSLDSHFSRSTIMNCREFYHLAFFSLSVLPMPFLIVIFMCFPIRFMPFSTLEFLLPEVFWVFLTISFVVFSLLFTMSNIILFLFLAVFVLVGIVSSVLLSQFYALVGIFFRNPYKLRPTHIYQVWHG